MRPELALFRELDTLVRNLGDQLAGYRRRALAAESRTRELEAAADTQRLATTAAQDRADSLSDELAAAGEALRDERAMLARAQATIGQLAQAAEAAAVENAAMQGQPASPSERAVTRENAELRRRLELASARTRELSERLRFLRQQLATVPDK